MAQMMTPYLELHCLDREWLIYLAKNPSRLADEIPFYRSLRYSDIEQVVALDLEVDVLK